MVNVDVHCLLSTLFCIYYCYLSQKTRFNEDSAKGSNARKDKPLDIWPNGPDFLGYNPQPAAPNLDGEASDFYNKPARHDAAAADATHSLDEVDSYLSIYFMMVATYLINVILSIV